MFEKLKSYIAIVPVPVWIGGSLVLIFCFWWFSGAIGNWWENRNEVKFDKTQQEQAEEIKTLQSQKAELEAKARELEAQDIIKDRQVQELRQTIDKAGGKVLEQQKTLDKAKQDYQSDLTKIEQVKNGEVNKYDFCVDQCNEDAKLGYPCRANYCDTFK